MKFSTALISAAVLAASVASAPMKRDVDPTLVPDFGHAANVNPTGEFQIHQELHSKSNANSFRYRRL
jgi:hypothetical protein